MRQYLKHLSKKAGLPPGTPIHIGTELESPVTVSCLTYDKNGSHLGSLEEPYIIKGNGEKEEKISWVDIRGIHDANLIHKIGSHLGIHSLIVEDIVNAGQLPKLDEHADSFFAILKAITFQNDEIKLEHIALYFEKNVVVSCQENVGDTFLSVKDRIIKKKGKIAERSADYLFYALMDFVIDTYFNTLRQMDERILQLSEQVVVAPNQQTLNQIQHLKKQVQLLKRYFWYTRDIALDLKKSESELIDDEMDKYIMDLSDHLAHVIDISDSFREELIDLSERLLAAINLRSNDIMKALTIVAAIFLPLTFLAGLYGMNFKNMPELEWSFAYPLVLFVMLGIAIGLLLFFKHKKWLE